MVAPDVWNRNLWKHLTSKYRQHDISGASYHSIVT